MVHYTSHPNHHSYVCGHPVPNTGPGQHETDPAQTGCHQCRQTFAWRMAIEDTAVLMAIRQGADTTTAITVATTLAVGVATLVLHRLTLTGHITTTTDGHAVILERKN